ncbi:YpmS family protein [Lacticaseibacillus baoqingensis]|uniref:YpmS family protein n=1 Tax=Lacticaseibacillus baoqingensis TaxID=2486013 RepID=A0ABW4EAJ1_9LACO|nr:YpmS family protein [Lacticaseibacillus baoqingensis]
MKRADKKPRRPINLWRWATLILIGLGLGTGIWFTVKVLTPYHDPTIATTTSAPETGQPAFSVHLTKRQVNRIVDYYLNDYLKDSDIKYSLTVGDQAVLGGHFKFFGATIKFQLLFDPLVRSNGDVELKAKKLNIGSLPVPISYVLNYVGHSYKLPKWVKLNSSKETVVLKLSKFKLQNKMQIKATKIDLPNDAIDFSVYLPQK